MWFFCHSFSLHRQKTRVKDDEEEVETGCCYTCCIHCISSGCRGCFPVRKNSPRPTPQPPSPKPSLRSVSIQAGSSPSTLKLEEVVTTKKVAKELRNYWKPHMHDIRQNNQSTNWPWHLCKARMSRALDWTRQNKDHTCTLIFCFFITRSSETDLSCSLDNCGVYQNKRITSWEECDFSHSNDCYT